MSPHGKCCGDSSHHHEPGEIGIHYSLYTKIDKENVECLNEATEGSGKTVFKPWEDRLNFETFVESDEDEELLFNIPFVGSVYLKAAKVIRFVESDADEELLFNVPFVGNVKLKAVKVIGEDSDTHPSKMRLFKNRPSMTFDDTSAVAEQEFELVKDTTGIAEYATKVVTFNNVNHLTLHFPSNFGGETTKIYYIGLKGEFTEAHHHGVTICTYEARPMAEDHKNPLSELSPARLGH